MATSTLRAQAAAQAADDADIVAYAHEYLEQPSLHYWLEASPDYFRKERDRAVALGNWPRVGAE